MADQPPLRSAELDQSRKRSIAAALQEYRDTVCKHNFAMLRVLVDGMANSHDEGTEEEDAEEMRLEAFTDHYFQRDLPESVTAVQDLLSDEAREELVDTNALDGVEHELPDQQPRAEWFANVQARIAALNLPVPVTQFPPPDLEYLCSIAQGIIGPGLPYYRWTQQIAFIDGVGRGNVAGDRSTVLRGTDLQFAWEDWDIAVACKMGKAPQGRGGGLALYCRKDAEAKEWQWRYGLYWDEWHSELFDTVEQFLHFYAHHKEQNEADTAQDVRGINPLF